MISYAYSSVLAANAWRASIDWTVALPRFFSLFLYFFPLQIRFVSIKEYSELSALMRRAFYRRQEWDKNWIRKGGGKMRVGNEMRKSDG